VNEDVVFALSGNETEALLSIEELHDTCSHNTLSFMEDRNVPGPSSSVGQADAVNPLLQDKVALITGAGHGIGAAGAELFASEGANVYVADIDGAAASGVAGRIREAGGTASPLTVDVRNADAVAALRDDVLGSAKRLDILVNNVGHWVRVPPSFAESGPDDWQAQYETNFLHVLRVTHAFLPSMLERGTGTVINVSSVEGIRGYPPDPVYAACKAAVVHFTKSLAVEVAGKGVKVNGIAPDLTQSAQVDYSREPADKWPVWAPVGRMGEPVDQARALLFLASELSDFLVGHTIPTDGGSLAAGGWFRSTHRKGRTWTNRPFDP
jgi:NAD(P)-dependent dehydrogenase (short-subunit alcohol dehydrogenase family)